MFRFVRIRSSQARRFVPGREGLPAAEGPGVRLLHQVLGLFLGPRDAPSHSVDLICKRKRLLLESDAITRAFCQPPGLV